MMETDIYKTRFGPSHNAPLSISSEPGILATPQQMIVVGGPCSIESTEQAGSIMNSIAHDVTYFRGGVFRAGTFPGKDWGWKWELLQFFHDKAHELGKHNVVDVLDVRDLDLIDPYTDVFQVGARQSQHYALLETLGKQKKPVILKRGTWQKLSEFLGSLEYILKGGNNNIILCERGSVSYLDHVRWELSVSMIAMLKHLTKFPVIVDASHGSGNKLLVKQLTLSGLAAGADGCLIETHNTPEKSMSDAEQAVSINDFIDIVSTGKRLKRLL